MPIFIRGREFAQTSRRDPVFGSAMAADGRNKGSDLGATQCRINVSKAAFIIDPSAFKESVAASGLVLQVWKNISSGV